MTTITMNATQLWVHDQDEALAFYTDKVGLEVHEDVTVAEMGNFRWLAVGAPGQDASIVLMAIPGAPMFDDATQGEIRSLMGKGYAGTVFFATDDCHARYAEMAAKGVEFTQEPTETPYGIDCGFRDPSGNHLRMVQLPEGA